LRSRRNGLKRTGLLALAIVLALGTLGVGYAAWTESVYVQGTVNTGTLDINPISSASTFVYKVPNATGGYDIVVHYPVANPDPNPATDGDGNPLPPVASAIASFTNGGSDADAAQMTFTGLFPNVEFQADVGMIYCGTIPAKVSVATIVDPENPGATDALLAGLWDLWQNGDATYAPHTYGIWMDADFIPNVATPTPTPYADPLGIQLHQWDRLNITLHVRMPPDPTYAGQNNLGFTGIITVVQWNEYGST
jgi:hypothetical protein